MAYGRKIDRNTGEKAKENEAHVDVVDEIKLVKTPNDDICNCCLQKTALTEDHVPPQGTGNRGRWKYRSYLNYLFSPTFKMQYVENGISYKTVCRDCHAKIGRYDREISDMYSVLKAQLRYRGYPYQPILLRPNAIIRGVLSHFISSKTFHDKSPVDAFFRKIINNSDCPIPPEYHFYVYPFHKQEIRVFGQLAFPQKQEPLTVAVTYAVKIFPLAMLFSSESLPIDTLDDWNKYFNIGVTDEVEITFRTVLPVDDEWPERYLFSFGQFLGKGAVESIIAWPR